MRNTRVSKFLAVMLAFLIPFVGLPMLSGKDAYALESAIYLDGINGDDTNDASDASLAVKTVDRAYELAEDGSTIVVCGDTSFTNPPNQYDHYYAPAKSVTFTSINDATLTIKGYVVAFNADTIFEDIELINNISGSHIFANGHMLKFGRNFKLTETDQNGTGVVIIGGGEYGNNNLNPGSFGEGGNLIFESGEFGAIVAGPSAPYAGDADFSDDIYQAGTYKVSVLGNAKLRDLFCGYFDDWSAIENVHLDKTEIVIDGSDVEIGNLIGGSYSVYSDASQASVVQESVTVNLLDGKIKDIFAGSFVYGSKNATYNVENFTLEIYGGEITGDILSGGLTIAEGINNNNIVENVNITTAIPLMGTDIYSHGYKEGDGDESLSTSNVTITLMEQGNISQLLTDEDRDIDSIIAAEKKAINFDNSLSSSFIDIPDGFNEIYLVNGSKAVLSKDMEFDILGSSGEMSSILIKESEGEFPKLILKNPVQGNDFIKLNVVDSNNENTMPFMGQVLVRFASENDVYPIKFVLDESNSELINFGIKQIGTDVVVSEPPSYILSANPTSHTFKSEKVGYTTPSALEITIHNLGTGTINDLQATLEGQNPEAFILSELSGTSITSGSAIKVSVWPKLSLPANDYKAVTKISGDSQDAVYIPLSFTVSKGGSGQGESNSGSNNSTSNKVITEQYKFIKVSDYDTKKSIKNIDTSKQNFNKALNIIDLEDINNSNIEISLNFELLTELYEKNKSGKICFKLDEISYDLPLDIQGLISGIDDLIRNEDKKAYNLSLLVQKLEGERLLKAQEAYKKVYPEAEQASEFYNLRFVVKDKEGKEISFNSNDFNKRVNFSLLTTKKANSVFLYDEYNNSFDFVPAKFDDKDAVVSTNHHSIYIALENNVTFDDVNRGTWYEPYVTMAANKGLVSGTGSNMYEPSKNVTRAQFVQMIANATQLPKIDKNTKPYIDVLEGSWYFDAISRAKEAGILDKFTEDNFNPNNEITREEMATILAQVLKMDGRQILDSEVGLNLERIFLDANEITASFKSDIILVYRSNLMIGTGNRFEPKAATTRAQAATVQMNLLRELNLID